MLKDMAKGIPHHLKLQAQVEHYLDIYEKYFSEYNRLSKLKILEIGVNKGGSLAIWQQYFPNAEVHGIDIVDKRKVQIGTFHLGDQTDVPFLEEIANKHGPFDIIIDDGGHKTQQQVTSYNTLFQHTDLYVIEDLCVAYWDNRDSHELYTIMQFLLSQIHRMHRIHQTRHKPWSEKQYKKTRLQIKKEIEWIHFYDSIVFIKRAKDV